MKSIISDKYASILIFILWIFIMSNVLVTSSSYIRYPFLEAVVSPIIFLGLPMYSAYLGFRHYKSRVKRDN
jgi:ACR3 family arsenite efflux pump ArsB